MRDHFRRNVCHPRWLVEQINRAIAEMEKVIQTNASGAEESASAAAEMTAQAEQMKVHVADLIRMVGGSGRNAATALSTPACISR